MKKPQPIFEMASILVQVRRAGDKGICRDQLYLGTSRHLCIDTAVDLLKAKGMIYRIDKDRYCVTPDHRMEPEI